MIRDAVERCLQRVSEAVTKLGDQAPVLLPGQPCRDIRALGNRLRHTYDEVSAERIWEIVRNDLPALVTSCQVALRTLESERR